MDVLWDDFTNNRRHMVGVYVREAGTCLHPLVEYVPLGAPLTVKRLVSKKKMDGYLNILKYGSALPKRSILGSFLAAKSNEQSHMSLLISSHDMVTDECFYMTTMS